MKPLPLVLVALLAGAAGATSGWIATRCAVCAPVTAGQALEADIRPQGAAAKSAPSYAELAAKVENLERAIDAIHQDVVQMRSGGSRTAAVEAEPVAPVDQDTLTFAAAHRSAILAVIAEDRAEQARKAEEERKQRDIEQTLQRADRTAQRLGMNIAQTKQLEVFYETQRQRMDELRGTLQDGAGDPQAMRETFQEFRRWSETELTALYGSDLAGKVMAEGAGFGMGRGGQAFGGPGGGGQGANATGGGRRGRAQGAKPAAAGGADAAQQSDNGGG
jgi:hypothetical protein